MSPKAASCHRFRAPVRPEHRSARHCRAAHVCPDHPTPSRGGPIRSTHRRSQCPAPTAATPGSAVPRTRSMRSRAGSRRVPTRCPSPPVADQGGLSPDPVAPVPEDRGAHRTRGEPDRVGRKGLHRPRVRSRLREEEVREDQRRGRVVQEGRTTRSCRSRCPSQRAVLVSAAIPGSGLCCRSPYIDHRTIRIVAGRNRTTDFAGPSADGCRARR